MTSPICEELMKFDQLWSAISHHSEQYITPLGNDLSYLSVHYTHRSLHVFGQASLLSVWEVCNFKCFLLDGCYVSVLSSCIYRFTHSIQWYMNQIWQCKTGSHLSQILGVEKCQLQKTTAHWRWTSIYIAFETLLQHPQLYLTRYLPPWKPQACNLESFSALCH